jgi:hypothetical protein
VLRHAGLKYRRDALNHACSQLFGSAGRLRSVGPVGMFAGVQAAHARPDYWLLANDGRDLLRTRLRHMRMIGRFPGVAMGEREQFKENKYGETFRGVCASFQLPVLQARSRGISKTTAVIV